MRCIQLLVFVLTGALLATLATPFSLAAHPVVMRRGALRLRAEAGGAPFSAEDWRAGKGSLQTRSRPGAPGPSHNAKAARRVLLDPDVTADDWPEPGRNAGACMVAVELKLGESEDSLFRRFDREVKESGHLKDMERRRFFETRQERRKRKEKERLLRSKLNRAAARKANRFNPGNLGVLTVGELQWQQVKSQQQAKARLQEQNQLDKAQQSQEGGHQEEPQ